MNRYLVTVPLYGVATVEIMARNARDAVSFAVDKVEEVIEVSDNDDVQVASLMAYDFLAAHDAEWMGDGSPVAYAQEIDE